METGDKLKRQEELDKLFEIYCNSRIYPQSGEPSMREVARESSVSPKRVKWLKEKYKWEERRLERVRDTHKKVDKRRSSMDAQQIELVGKLYIAALNNQARNQKKYLGRDGKDKTYIECSITDTISLGKYYALLRGDPDSRPDNLNHGDGVIPDELKPLLKDPKLLKKLGNLGNVKSQSKDSSGESGNSGNDTDNNNG